MSKYLIPRFPAAVALLAFALTAAPGCGGKSSETPANPVQRPEKLEVEKPGGAAGRADPGKSRAGGTLSKPTNPNE